MKITDVEATPLEVTEKTKGGDGFVEGERSRGPRAEPE